jgi:hypothetical protein
MLAEGYGSKIRLSMVNVVCVSKVSVTWLGIQSLCELPTDMSTAWRNFWHLGCPRT